MGQGRPEARREYSRPGNHQPRAISELLKEGQEILVQIAKEPLGTKGARITSHIALPGRYLVYMPTINHIGVSRKIASDEERLRLRNIILDNKGSLSGGFIVRTAGGGRSEEELKADLKFLSTLWNEIRTKAEQAKAPALIHRDLDLVQRILRDVLSPDFKSVRMDHEADYERALEFVNRCQPSLVAAVKLYTRDTPLFEEFGIQAEIEKALKPKVWLKSGGYIVINQTEALVAIDVNTGKYVGKTNRLEDTILKTNIDAVKEIVRQIRLRDLGGIIVIDFIDMDERRNRMKVAQTLEEALRRDRAPTKIVSFNEFGLVAITRKRVKQSLERTLCERCNYCSGAGWIKSPTSVCNEILAEARKMAKQIEGEVLTLRVNPEVAKALKSRDGLLVSELESLTHKDIVVKSDPAVHQEQFEIY
jgi:ribonuclease G